MFLYLKNESGLRLFHRSIIALGRWKKRNFEVTTLLKQFLFKYISFDVSSTKASLRRGIMFKGSDEKQICLVNVHLRYSAMLE